MVTTAAAPLTLEEFSRLPRNGQRHEISDGILITVPPAKSLHSRIARLIFKVLESWLEKSGRAEALIEAGYVLAAEPLTIRQPDISVLSLERIRTTLPDSYFAGAPELAVEIISPSDTAEETELKVQQYLRAGGKEVWIIYPKTRTVHVLRTGSVQIFSENDMLESPELLPGFSVKVADLFRLESAVQ